MSESDPSSIFGQRPEASPFRKAALQRISSPEQLDRLIVIMQPHAWAALAMICMLLLVTLGWSVVGTIPTYVRGNGLLMPVEGNIVSAQAGGSGRLADLLVHPDDLVAKGQVIARLVHAEMDQQYLNASELVRERIRELERQRAFADAEIREKRQASEQRTTALNRLCEALKEQIEAVSRKLADEERLMKSQATTRQVVMQTTQSLHQLKRELAETENQIAQIDVENLDLAFRAQQRVYDAEASVADARRRVAELGEARSAQSAVVAPQAGRVMDIEANVGTLVERGQTILSIEEPGAGLELRLFVPPHDGDKVRVGMPVRISPNSTRREEDGTLLGVVTNVSDLPMTPEALKSLLHNQELARLFSRSGPPFMVTANLEADPGTKSGYRWSSSRGNNLVVEPQTLATADVTVKQQSPISLAIPLLREYTGL